MASPVEYLPRAELVRDLRLRCRSALDAGHVRRLAEAMSEAADGWGGIPPLAAVRLTEPSPDGLEPGDKSFPVHPAGAVVLVGGYHRDEAAGQAGTDPVPCLVVEGTWNDALRAAWKANADHGLPRAERDLWQVLRAIEAHPKYGRLGERQVADLAGCSRATVNRYRAERARWAAKTQAELPFAAASPAERAAVRDAWGAAVPDFLEEQFRCVRPANALLDRLRKVAEDLIRLKYDDRENVKEPGLDDVDVRGAAGAILQLADSLADGLPFVVCPTCGGVGTKPKGGRCDTCLGETSLTRVQAAALPPEAERQARGEAA